MVKRADYGPLGEVMDQIAWKKRRIRGPYNVARYIREVTGGGPSGPSFSAYYHDKSTPNSETMRRFCEERGWPYDPDEDGKDVARAIRSWQPFPDTRPALERTRAAGLRLMVVSNTDRDIIEHSLRHIEVPFDEVQVAEDVRAYKPSDEVFRRALERIGEPPERVLHVAFGFKYDIGPAERAGMRTAWINRHDEPPPGGSPYDHEWRDLWGLARFAESGS